jgi:DNA-binding response OmpR family regulator
MTAVAKILIIDDDPVARRVLHAALIAKNYQTIIASDAMAAISEAQRSRPDLILLDLGLPAGGGMLVLQRLASFPRLAVIPVVVISGQDPAAAAQPALDAGARAFLPKPVRPEDVVAKVEELLGKP